MTKSFESSPLPLIFVITDVWLILIAICTVIWKFIVPINTEAESYFIVFTLSSFKVGISLLMIFIWLLGWYKALNYLLAAQFYQNQVKNSKDGQNNP